MKTLKDLTRATASAVNMNLLDRWASVVAGAVIAGSAVRRKPSGKLRLVLAAEMIRRGVAGHCFAYQALGVRSKRTGLGRNASLPYELGIRARAAVTISKPRATVYRFWRNFENLPRIMKHLVSVDAGPEGRSHWKVEGPAGTKLEWDAEIHNDIENELIAWRSLPGSEVASAGSVHFKDAPGGRGTEVVVELQYNPPAGLVAASVAKLFGRDAESDIESSLFALKQFLEVGEVATSEGQTHGPSSAPRKAAAGPAAPAEQQTSELSTGRTA